MSSHSYRGMSANGVLAMGIVINRYPRATVTSSGHETGHVTYMVDAHMMPSYYGPSARTIEEAWEKAAKELKPS